MRYTFSKRLLLTCAAVLSLVTVGGQCRGSLAQAPERKLEVLTDHEPLLFDGNDKPANPAAQSYTDKRKTAIAQCKEHGGIPVVIAGVLASEGIGCAQPLGL